MCINKNTACSTVQGKDKLSQIKVEKGETTREEATRENRRVKGYSVHLYRISFFNGFSSRYSGSERGKQERKTNTGRTQTRV